MALPDPKVLLQVKPSEATMQCKKRITISMPVVFRLCQVERMLRFFFMIIERKMRKNRSLLHIRA